MTTIPNFQCQRPRTPQTRQTKKGNQYEAFLKAIHYFS